MDVGTIPRGSRTGARGAGPQAFSFVRAWLGRRAGAGVRAQVPATPEGPDRLRHWRRRTATATLPPQSLARATDARAAQSQCARARRDARAPAGVGPQQR